MRTVETTVYQFDELSDKAKEKAREWFREASAHDEFWEFVYEDAATIAELMGINLRQKPVKLMGGGTRYDPCIWFSGFWSQGDGACFEGSWEWRENAGAKVREHAPQDTELHRIADELAGYKGMSASVKHSGHYYHSGCMDIDVSGGEDWEGAAKAEGWSVSRDGKRFVDRDGNYCTDPQAPSPEDACGWENLCALECIDAYAPDDVELDVKQTLRAFADWIYRALEKEHEYQNSDETVDENIRANEYEFEEDGSRA